MRTVATALMLGACLTGSLRAEERSEPLGELIDSFGNLVRLDYDNSPAPALKDLQAWHQATEEESIRVTWTMMPSVNTQERTVIDLYNGTSQSQNYVYSWAFRGGFRTNLRTERLVVIKEILKEMPEGIQTVKDTRDMVLISFHQGGTVQTLSYKRLDLPPAIMRLFLLGRVDIDVAPAGEHPHIRLHNPRIHDPRLGIPVGWKRSSTNTQK